MSTDAKGCRVERPGSPLSGLLGDSKKLADKHPKKLWEFFGWGGPMKESTGPIENDIAWIEQNESSK